MKIALAFLLLGLVLLSEQQRFPYQFQQRVIPPWMYLDTLSDRDLYSYMLARKFGFPGLRSSFIPQENAFLGNNEPAVVQNSPSSPDKTEELDVLSRNNGAVQPADSQAGNPRFLLNFVTTIGSTNTFYNPLQKTIYYFTTTTTTITSTTTCITSTAFTSSSYTLICRKRRELLEFLSAMDQVNDEAETITAISPSSVQQVVPTADPAPGVEQFKLASSMDEDTLALSETSGAAGDISARVKRLFVSTTIVTTYVFSTATTTRTLSVNLAAAAALSCRPSQFTYCILSLLLGFAVLLSQQQRFPHHPQSRVLSPLSYLDALSDRDLYSYILARRLALLSFSQPFPSRKTSGHLFTAHISQMSKYQSSMMLCQGAVEASVQLNRDSCSIL